MTANVLVVDDDPAIRQALGLRLSAAGHQVNTVASGEDGLLACSPDAPDVIILDVSMPGMGGFEACARIRETIAKSIAIIFLTGVTSSDTSSGLEQSVRQSGGDYFIAKPYDSALLLELIDRIMISEQAHQTSVSAPERTGSHDES